MNKEMTTGRRPLRRGILAGLGLGLAVGLVWTAFPGSPPPGAAPDPSPAMTGAAGHRALEASASPPGASAAMASPGRLPAGAEHVAIDPDARRLSPERLAEIETQWCTHGLQAHQQSRQVLEQAYPVTMKDGRLDMHALKAHVDAQSRELGAQAQNAVQERLKGRWISQLRQQGDPRSLALADYLLTTVRFGPEATEAFQHLLGLAQSTRDPMVFMVWQLAKPYCWRQDFCKALPLSAWRELEPENLLAWLPAHLPGDEPPALDWSAIQRSRHARSYLEEAQALLLPLLEQEPPGLTLQAGLAFVNQLDSLWPITKPGLALFRPCMQAADTSQGARQAACRVAAELLWRSPSAGLLDFQVALGMAETAGLQDQSPWAQRMAFAKDLTAEEGKALHALEFRSPWSDQACEAQPRLRQVLKDRVRLGFWAAAVGPARWRAVP